MSDNVFEILIKFGLSKEKATEAVNELKKIQEQTKTTGKEGVKAEEAVDEATKKTFASKKQLKDMVKQLGHEFPVLASVARAALNPIVISAGLIAASLAIVRDKLRDVGAVMETSNWKTDKVNAAAEAWKEYAKWIADSKSSASGLEASLKNVSEYMKTIAELGKRSGKDTDANPIFARKGAETEAQLKEQAAAALRAKAKELRSKAEKAQPGASEQRDKNTQSSLDEDAAKAAAEIATLDAEIKNLENIYSPENAGNPKYVVEHLKASAKYGVTMNPDDIIGTLKKQRSGYQGFIDLAARGKSASETNAARRTAADSMRSKANDFDTQAAGLEDQAKETRFRGNVAFYAAATAQGVTPVVTPNGRGFSVTPEVKAFFDKANADLLQIGKEWAAAVAGMRQQMEAEAKAAKHVRDRQ